jgi:hypothetical protein
VCRELKKVENLYSRQWAHRWREVISLAPIALYSLEIFLVLISVRSSLDPKAVVRLEGLGQLKNPMMEIEPASFRLVA